MPVSKNKNKLRAYVAPLKYVVYVSNNSEMKACMGHKCTNTLKQTTINNEPETKYTKTRDKTKQEWSKGMLMAKQLLIVARIHG